MLEWRVGFPLFCCKDKICCWGGDRGGVEKNIHKKYFQILSITKNHKNSQKITKNHKKSQKITKVNRFGPLQLCCNCGVIVLSNAQLCSVVRKCV